MGFHINQKFVKNCKKMLSMLQILIPYVIDPLVAQNLFRVTGKLFSHKTYLV